MTRQGKVIAPRIPIP